jgi:hypothetical protein
MPIPVDELPNSIRVKLAAAAEQALWERVEQVGGITAVAGKYGYTRSNLYNWKHKDTFLPIAFVRAFVDAPDITALKGGGRSQLWPDPPLPIPVDDELLTRIDCSVHVNRDGVPVYQTDDPGLVQRFVTLLERYDGVPITVYQRTQYEVRYPKYVHAILQEADYDPVFAARVDELGQVTDDHVVTGDRDIAIAEFTGTLYHRGKKLQLALARGDTDTVTQLMASEAEKVQRLVQQYG